MGESYNDTEFLSLANQENNASESIDRMKKNTEKESSFWGKGMENLVPGAFKGSSAASKKPASKEEEKSLEAKKKAKELEEAKGLIRKHNAYLRNPQISSLLASRGYHCQKLQLNTPLETVKSQLEEINTIRNEHMARDAADLLMQGVNKITESFLPELKGSPSFSEIWMANSKVEGSSINLNMEEMSIELQPYISVGFWGRFAMSYFQAVQMVLASKKDPEFRARMAAQEKLSKEYDSDLENQYNTL